MKYKVGLLTNSSTRISRQHLAENNMFGSKRKGIQLGKTFRKSGKGIMKNPTSARATAKEKGISPSLDEFDKMMKNVSLQGSMKDITKKSMFSRK